MIRNFIIILIASLLVCPILLPGRAEACDVAVVSGKVTTNGRPILWKSRDCSANWHQELEYFPAINSRAGGCVMVHNYDDLAWINNGVRENPSGGLNEAGLAVSCTSVYEDFNPYHEAININTDLIRETLQECATLDDFDTYLKNWYNNHAGMVISGNFVVIDAQGGAALYECYTGQIAGQIKYRKYDANTGRETDWDGTAETVMTESREGEDDFNYFYNRANNNSYININFGEERAIRANELLNMLVDEGNMNYRTLMRVVTKDVTGNQLDPVTGTVLAEEEEDLGNYSTTYCISRNQTRTALVVDGVKAGDNPALSVFYCALGEPSISVYTPYFAHAQAVSWLCHIDSMDLIGRLYDLNDTCFLNRAMNRREAYDNLIYKTNTGDVIQGMDNVCINKIELAAAQEWTLPLEDFILDMTAEYIDDMRGKSSYITQANLASFSDYCVEYLYENYNAASADYYPWTMEKPWGSLNWGR
ncbi:MAG: hypothetical protein CVV44_21030 [Spirochaetae bacterium HGW-Spirochaetae-1]|nr:MAG: hypothetical protein CVV44_21030 [Spirochaetae bacterium HGW-Spirochaetae-1]